MAASIMNQAHRLDGLYTFRNRDAVVVALKQHPTLVPVLEQLPPMIARYFPDSPLALQWVLDPEEQSLDGLWLYVTIMNDLDRKERFARQHGLSCAFDAAYPSDVTAHLNIGFDYPEEETA